MKNILGLDLGTTSIGFAKIIESDNRDQSAIDLIGVRVNPLTTDEQTNFEKGKPVSINADRTLKRGMRRNLFRYQLRRDNLIEALTTSGIITEQTPLAEDGKGTTYSTIAFRAKAATEKIPLEAFARVLLSINKKRGYKSSRKAKNEEEGELIDGMAIAKRLYEEHLTPGELCLLLLQEGKRSLPDFYRSDLIAERDRIWAYQKQFYPQLLTDDFKKHIEGKGQKATAAAFYGQYNFNTAENKGTREEKRLKAYQWRSDVLHKQLSKEELAYVLTDINNDLHKSSGYLGGISDRSKELYFNKQTVGQYLHQQIVKNRHTRLKGQVFYRQDYMDEFETIWQTQAKFHKALTIELKEEVRDIIIFYQRKLKSQKGTISFCEFESKEVTIENDGKLKKKKIGLRVAPKSSPLFQEFKIWQVLNNVELRNKKTKEIVKLNEEAKHKLFDELNIKGVLLTTQAIKILGHDPKDWEANYAKLEGNRTQYAFYNAYLKILEIEGYDEALLKASASDEWDVARLTTSAQEIERMVKDIFKILGINTAILNFDAELEGKAFEQQPSYQLWHLLYSAEDDHKKYEDADVFMYGKEHIGLKKKLCEKFGFSPEHAKIIAGIVLSEDYGNLSSKAMRKIFPFIKELSYDKACAAAGYRHSAASLTKEEIEQRALRPRLELLKKNELRSPVVEKILNQMVNLVNALIDRENEQRRQAGLPQDFNFDEIRIELGRSLKKSAEERREMTANIAESQQRNERVFKMLQAEFGIKHPTRNDVIRYKLYEELKNNGYHDLYTNQYIPKEILFSRQIDVDHIIPQMTLFDDSFSNKTLCFRKENQDKGNKTAYDYIQSRYGEQALEQYLNRITALYEQGKQNKEEGIGRAKFLKLQKQQKDIGDGFIERDLRESQYVAKKAKDMLLTISKSVISTTGEITSRLREDWDLVNVMQELNLPKFKALGLTEIIERKDGSAKERIVDWSKRNDHRHHALDALTIAFTKHSHIQYLNHLNARKDEGDKKWHTAVNSIEQKETTVEIDDTGNRKRKFIAPMPNFREVAKEHLESVLVSHKTKNKVVTKNKNKTKSSKGILVKTELTPRGQLHKETVYGKYHYYVSKEEKIGAKFDEGVIQMVADPLYQKLLLQRLAEYGNDPKKAFTGKNALSKSPIFLDHQQQNTLPEKVKITWLEEDYSIRKEVTPENFKDLKTIEKIIDEGAKRVLLKRLEEHGNDPKKAFAELDKKPIWLNEKAGISIKRVTISGIKNAEPLHHKRDHLGNHILNKQGNPIPVDFVSTGNNHHVAIYRDEMGNLQDRIVSLFDAVRLAKSSLEVVDKSFNQGLGWRFLFTMKQNELFVFPNAKSGFDPKEIDLLDPKNRILISPNLFRVQTISKVEYGNSIVRDFLFRNHLDATKASDLKNAVRGLSFHQCKSLSPLEHIVKVRINHIGQIISVGEY